MKYLLLVLVLISPSVAAEATVSPTDLELCDNEGLTAMSIVRSRAMGRPYNSLYTEIVEATNSPELIETTPDGFERVAMAARFVEILDAIYYDLPESVFESRTADEVAAIAYKAINESCLESI
jgi:hypothetical protein